VSTLILDKDLSLEKLDLSAISNSDNIKYKIARINEAAENQYSN
jgi:hypothetical protein